MRSRSFRNAHTVARSANPMVAFPHHEWTSSQGVFSGSVSGVDMNNPAHRPCSSTASDATPTSAANVRVGAVAAEEFAGVELVMMVLRVE
ncbi:hypothetical protein [Dermacoccus abyssi]|nr:hypothetical protein [Dermacoccus abyssi]